MSYIWGSDVETALVTAPLGDLRVIAVEQYGAGPFGSLQLADLGAEVIKIEDPGSSGDVGRYIVPFQQDEDSLFFETFNRNKRSLSLQLSTEAGRAIFEDLVRTSDAVYSNVRGDVPERLRITYDDLKHINERIVCCLLTGYGMNGPRKTEGAYDYLMQGMAGWMSMTGEPDGPPTKSGLSVVDLAGGFVAALALLAGVHAARRDGKGMNCDLGLFDVAVGMLNYPATWYLTEEYETPRTSNSAHPSLVPFQNFETADSWIVVGCAKEKFWARLTEVLDRRDLLEDPRYASFALRGENRDSLTAELAGEFMKKTSREWLETLTAAQVPSAPVNSLGEVFAEEQVAARDLIVEVDHPRFGTVRQVASPVRVGNAPIVHRRAPQRNEDADYVLRTLLGYSDGDIDKAAAAGAFG